MAMGGSSTFTIGDQWDPGVSKGKICWSYVQICSFGIKPAYNHIIFHPKCPNTVNKFKMSF